MSRPVASAGPTTADIDRRKARIVACLHPTRIERGFTTDADCKRLGELFGVSARTVRAWGDGGSLPADDQLPAIERWLASGPVYRYAGVGRIEGPEAWPEPLDMPVQTPEATAEPALLASVEPSPRFRPVQHEGAVA